MLMAFGTHNDQNGIILGNWFAEKNKKPVFPPFSCIGFLDNNQNITGVCVFNDYSSSSVELHVYLEKYLTRQKIRCIYRYVFEQLKCNIVIAKPQRDNKKVITALNRSGFKYLCVIPKYYGNTRNQDAVLYFIDADKAERWK